ncbi:MAG: hypothetical protein ABR584_07805 [Candidatus Baltobacteraceae bacterium]
MIRRAAVSLALIASFNLAGCSSRSPEAAVVAPTPNLSDAEIRYGVAPTRNSQVVYQPDVIIPEGGANAVRSVSANGLTWTIDATAPHASELAEGKIFFITGRGVGRVLHIDRNGGDLSVTLGPVQLTDVIQQAHLSGTQALDPSMMRAYSAPDWPGAEAEPIGEVTPVGAPDRRVADVQPIFASFEHPLQVAQAGFPGGQLPALGPPKELSTKTFSFNPFSGGGLGANFYFPSMNYGKARVRAQGSIMIHLNKPFISWDITITPQGIKTAKLEVHNAAGLTVHFEASTSSGFTPEDNKKGQVFLPMDLSLPLGGPVPLAVTIHQEFALRTAFSAKESTLTATGDYNFDGSLKVECTYGSCTASAPTSFKIEQSLINSISGPSLGVNAIVIAYEGRVIVGLGSFGFVTGPYFGYGVSLGTTKGSDASAFIQTCRQADMNVWARVGVGYAIPQVVARIINFFLNAIHVKPIASVGGPGKVVTIYDKHERDGCGGDPNAAK